jgi:hypothetical protein
MDLDQAVDHVYAPFTGPREIRIAVIEPSVDYDAPLQFSFQQAPLEDLEGAYEAVSYVWGAPILTFPVYHTTVGSRICVTENLDKALRRRRHRLDRRCLWADAMCIDQRNDREKEIQIPLMVDIFRGAKRVLAWIHEGDEAIERGMRHIDRLSRQSITHETYFEEDGTRHSVIQDMVALINLPYFRRLWIVQEIVFSLDITLICGKSKLSWLRLSKGLIAFQSGLQSNKYMLGDENKGLWKVADLWRRNAIVQDLDSSTPSRRHHEHILDLVIEFRIYGCTDGRDRIFAVHALSQQNHARVAIDYTLDVYATYRSFALACMADGRTLTVLYAARARLDMESHASWPSWIPDWRRMPASITDQEYKHSSMIDYACEVNEGTIELKINHISSFTLRNYRPLLLTVCTEGVVCMGQSVFTFFNAICNLYKGAFDGSPVNFEAMWRFLRIIFWTIGIGDPQLRELKSHMDLLWQMPGKYTQKMKEDEVLLGGPILELMKGYCIFTAEYKDVFFHTPFCFGRVNIKAGDIILAVEKIGESDRLESQPVTYYRTLILRPAKPPNDKIRTVPEGAHWTKTPYRIIGDAWLLFPTHPLHADVRIYLC